MSTRNTASSRSGISPFEVEVSERTGGQLSSGSYSRQQQRQNFPGFPFSNDHVSSASQLRRRSSDATEDTFSTTDGIDVLGKDINKSDNFADFNQSWSGKLVTNRWVKRVIITLIMLNALSMGLSTSDWATQDEEVAQVFLKLDLTFQILFTIELFLKALHWRLHIFVDGWGLFDLLTISLAWVIPSLLLLRTFRLVRTLRLATKLPPLRKLVLAIFESSPKVAAILVLMVLLLYIFAVLFTSFFQDLYQDGHTSFDYFSTLSKSMFTLLQVMTFDGWADLTKEVMEVYPYSWLVFVLFLSVTSFFVLNLIIAVVCEAVFYVQSTESRKGASLSMSESSNSPNSSGSVSSRRRNRNSTTSQRLTNEQGKEDSRFDALEEKMEKLASVVEAALKLHQRGLDRSDPLMRTPPRSPYRNTLTHDVSFTFGAPTPPRTNIARKGSASMSFSEITSVPSSPRTSRSQHQSLPHLGGEFT